MTICVKLKLNQTNLVLTLLQMAAGVVALLGTLFAMFLFSFGITVLQNEVALCEPFRHMPYALLGLVTVAAVSLCSYGALAVFGLMCQRLKQGTAFTKKNEASLGRIALLCGISGVVIGLAALVALVCYGGFALFFMELTLLAATAYLCVALAAWALRLLLQRGILLEQENRLTI